MSVEEAAIASAWLAALDAAFASGNPSSVAALLLSTGWLRDLLVFDWDFHSFCGTEKIVGYLVGRLDDAQATNFALDARSELRPSSKSIDLDMTAIEVAFTFGVLKGSCRGIAYLVPDDQQGWKALTVMVMLDSLKDHEELGHESGLYGNHTMTWQEVWEERKMEIEKDPEVLILGAGQTGLQVAARFKQMGLRTLVIDKNAKIGDNWRSRYPSLKLNTSRVHHQFLYAPYPSTWPTFAPRDKIAFWLEHYAESQDLLVWLRSTILPTPSYSSTTKRWTMRVQRGDDEVTLHPAHIVLATGTLGDPHLPSISTSPTFIGPQLHSSVYAGGTPFAGKRVVVIGSGTTSADICLDLVRCGAARVTMIQRSRTIVVSRAYMTQYFAQKWPEGVPIEVSDLRINALPLRHLKQVLIGMQPSVEAFDHEMLEGLRRKGFVLSSGEDGAGRIWELYTKLSGYLLDVGCAALIADGRVGLKSGVEIARLEPNNIFFNDGSELQADAIIYATGYKSIRDSIRKIFGDDTIDRTSVVWGVDEEGELRGCYRPSGHDGLWFAAGDFAHSRFFSKSLGIQIHAELLGIKNPTPVEHTQRNVA